VRLLNRLKHRLGAWLLDDEPTITIKEYEGSTAISVENERLGVKQIWYVQKWDAPCDKVIERLEGTEYTRTDDPDA